MNYFSSNTAVTMETLEVPSNCIDENNPTKGLKWPEENEEKNNVWVDNDYEEEIGEDYTTEHPAYGLMRPIEVEKGDKKYNCPIMRFCIRPPYWKAKNMRMCYVPIT